MTLPPEDRLPEGPLPKDNEEAIREIVRMREAGAEQAEMEQTVYGVPERFLLMAYEVYPNGTTSPIYVQDPGTAKEIGRRMGIGDPSDRLGWAIWTVPDPA